MNSELMPSCIIDIVVNDFVKPDFNETKHLGQENKMKNIFSLMSISNALIPFYNEGRDKELDPRSQVKIYRCLQTCAFVSFEKKFNCFIECHFWHHYAMCALFEKKILSSTKLRNAIRNFKIRSFSLYTPRPKFNYETYH